MAEKRPICNYDGTKEELRVGDTLVGDSSVDGGSAASVYLETQSIDGGEA